LTPPAPQAACLHGPDAAAEQQARRRDALRATRTVNNMQANQAGAAQGRYLKHTELPNSAFARGRGGQAEFFKKLDLTPGQDLLPGWGLTLDVTENGYWFMIKDKTDPCGFAFISNQSGLIYTAEPLR
jgi:hypothetical protein